MPKSGVMWTEDLLAWAKERNILCDVDIDALQPAIELAYKIKNLIYG